MEEEILDKDATVYLAVTLLVHLDQKLVPDKFAPWLVEGTSTNYVCT